MPSLNRRSALGLAGLGLAGGGLGWYLTRSATGAVTAPEQRPEVDEEAIETVATDVATFGFDLLDTLAAERADENSAISPLGIALPLVMLSEGAAGETEEQLRDGLSLRLGSERLHPAFGALLYDLESHSTDAGGRTLPSAWEREEFDLGVATTLWGQEGLPFREPFLDTIERNYGPALRTADFRADPGDARDRVNDWVADTTDGQIEGTVPGSAIDELTRLVVANAVYLFADWAEPFDPDDTTTEQFTGLDGTESQVSMMQQTEDFPVAFLGDRPDRTAAVELPYVGESTSMVCILPPAGRFRAFEHELDADRFAEITDALDEQEVRLSLPRFEFDTELRLSSVLSDLGISAPFDHDRADFEGIVPQDAVPGFALTELFNETLVSVDEEGTEAVSVSVAIMGGHSGPMSVRFDRPFLFVIRDRETNTPLFLGRVVDGETL